MFNLESIKSKYKNVRFDLISIALLIIGLLILYYGIIKYFGYRNYLKIIGDIFGRTGGAVHSYDTQKNKMTGIYLIITGSVLMGVGIILIKNIKKIL
jgi:hypothetical protein